MNNNLDTTDRALPAGYSEKSSAFYVPSEERDAYQSTTVPQATLERLLSEQRERIVRDEGLATWEQFRAAQQEQRSPGSYERWLEKNTRNGDPTEASIQAARDDLDPFRNDRDFVELTPTQLSVITHAAVLDTIRAEAADKHAATQAAERARRASTCPCCGAEGVAPTADRDGVRACPGCHALAPLVRAALTPTSTHPTRLAAIVERLIASGSLGDRSPLTQERIEWSPAEWCTTGSPVSVPPT